MHRSKKYCNYIDQQPCLICGAPATHHHEDTLGVGGMSLKCHDALCLPLCGIHHKNSNNAVHHKPRRFWTDNNIDPAKEQLKLIIKYMIEAGI